MKEDLEWVKELEREIEKNREKYKEILDEEQEIIKIAMEKWNIDTKEKLLEESDVGKMTHAIVLKNVLNIKEKENAKI